MPTPTQDFLLPNDPLLTQIAQPIPINDIQSPQTKKLIEKLLSVAFNHRKERTKPTVVGLAAPQIGISKRIIAVDIGATPHGGLADLQIFINPQITWTSEEQEEWCEGCWSTDRVCGAVTRPHQIKLQAYTPQANPIENIYTGYTARIFQHEIDHLNGQEFVTHITDDNKLHWVEPDQFITYKTQEAWRTWPHKCPRKRWKKIKGIKSDVIPAQAGIQHKTRER